MRKRQTFFKRRSVRWPGASVLFFVGSTVPKDGGNPFQGVSNVEYTGKGMQSSNFSEELLARG